MSHPFHRSAVRGSLAVAAAGLTACASASAASGGPPLHHAMGCYAYYGGALQFSQAVELLSATNYGLAPDVHKHHLSGRQSTGAYRRTGNTLTFKTGPSAKLHLTGVWTNQHKEGDLTVGAGLTMYRPHKVHTGVKCYPM